VSVSSVFVLQERNISHETEREGHTGEDPQTEPGTGLQTDIRGQLHLETIPL